MGDDMLGQCGGTGSTPRWLLYDGHGSARQLVESVADVTSRYDYDAYGVAVGASPPSAETSLRYSGEQRDEGLGMYYLRARYLNSDTGHFNRLDPWSGNTFAPRSLHEDAHAHGNSVSGVDPSGQFSVGAPSNVGELVLVTAIILILAACGCPSMRDRPSAPTIPMIMATAPTGSLDNRCLIEPGFNQG